MLKQHYQKALESISTHTLYIVATPIGNLADITLRALAVLSRADLICAEDTRITARLLRAYGIQTKLISVREHNEQQMSSKVLAALADNMVVAQVSDAGTPAVCDPGAKLAMRVRAAGFKVVPVLGASAVMGALSAAGIDESDFYFQGFLPAKAGARRKLLATFSQTAYPVVMFETPHRIVGTLTDMAHLFPERTLLLAREISKVFETFLHGTVAEIYTILLNDTNQSRGETVLVLHPVAKEKHHTLTAFARHVINTLAAELPTKQAAELAAKITGENKKTLYSHALADNCYAE